jgi:hypothetical protein
MTALKVDAEIGRDGKLRLDVPTGLPAGRVEVLVIVQAEANGERAPEMHPVRSGLFVGKPVPTFDVDLALHEMNQAWKSKLSE